MKVRPYQEEAIQSCLESFGARQDHILSLPTGAGKTFTSVEFCKRVLSLHPQIHVIWLVHRIELLGQAMSAFTRAGLSYNSWTADQKFLEPDKRVTIAMVASSRSLAENLRAMYPQSNYLVIVDEAHHSPARSYQTVFEGLGDRLVCKQGLTATPVRLDGQDLDFDEIAYQKTFLDIVNMGYLAKPKYVRICTHQRYNLRMRGGDFERSSLQDLDNEDRNNLIAEEWMKNRELYQKALMFSVSREHGRNLYDALCAAGEENVAYVDGSHPKAYRDQVVEWFRTTPEGILINVELFIEGFDVPDTKTIFLTRPTASKTFWFQMIGRGSRIAPNKHEFYIVDFIDSVKRYAMLVEEWSIEELDADPDPELEEERDTEEYAQTIRQVLEEEGIQVPKRRTRREIAEIVGILKYASRFNQDTIAITRTQAEALDDLYRDLFSSHEWNGFDTYDAIGSSYDRYVADIEERAGTWRPRAWKHVAWAMYLKFRRKMGEIEGHPTFRYIPIENLMNAEEWATDEAVGEIAADDGAGDTPFG